MDGLSKDDGRGSKLGKLEEEFKVYGAVIWAVVEVPVFLLWGGKSMKRVEVLLDLHSDGIGRLETIS